jgi:hypothetical protein
VQDQRRLSGTIRAEQGNALALVDVEIDAFECDVPSG